ncbi:MAG: hypothetical protein ACKOQ6_07545 [Bacteroidota bacterium]
MTNVFQTLPSIKKGFFTRLFSSGPDENAFVDLNNLLASKPVMQISKEEVAEVITRHEVDVFRHFSEKVEGLYTAYLAYCVKDHGLEQDDVEQLRHLKSLLQISDHQIDAIHKKIGESVLIEAWQTAIGDGRLSPDEEKKLDVFGKALVLPQSLTDEISALTRELFVRQHIKGLMDDRRLTPQEEDELKRICSSLNVTPQFDEATISLLDRFRLFYAVENGVIPQIECDINLTANEECHFKCPAQWHEYRSVTRRVNYGGPAVSVKIMKGVYYRAGSMSVQPIRSQELQLIGTGRLYITNKRIIFVGENKATTIRFNKVVTLNPYSNGIEIIKDAGKSPTIITDQSDAEMLYLLLCRLISESD